MPIISASTQAREEGYFRREWNLAVGRTRDMADDAAFLLPVVIDATPEPHARVLRGSARCSGRAFRVARRPPASSSV